MIDFLNQDLVALRFRIPEREPPVGAVLLSRHATCWQVSLSQRPSTGGEGSGGLRHGLGPVAPELRSHRCHASQHGHGVHDAPSCFISIIQGGTPKSSSSLAHEPRHFLKLAKSIYKYFLQMGDEVRSIKMNDLLLQSGVLRVGHDGNWGHVACTVFRTILIQRTVILVGDDRGFLRIATKIARAGASQNWFLGILYLHYRPQRGVSLVRPTQSVKLVTKNLRCRARFWFSPIKKLSLQE